MPRTADVAEIRRILETERIWAAYALADLEPDHFPYCEWIRTTDDPPAIALIYREFAAPVLLAVGDADRLLTLFDEADRALGDAGEVYLIVKTELFSMLEGRFELIQAKRMRRMVLEPDLPVPKPDPRARRLATDDLDALQRLYADGDASGESPDFFTPAMLEGGVYFGVWEDASLTAVAGTHVVAPSAGVAAIGNVYTRRDRRRRSLGAIVTNAVASFLRGQNLSTIVLNVWSQNPTAMALYKRLGFRHHCDFYEAHARRH